VQPSTSARLYCTTTISPRHYTETIYHYQRPATVPSIIRHHYHTGSLVVHKRKQIQRTCPLSFSLFPSTTTYHHFHAATTTTTTTTTTGCGSKSKISSASASASATPWSSLPALATLPDLLFAAPPSPEDSHPARCALIGREL
jgi:hypothetical protein